MCCLKVWQHYLGTHKTKVFTDSASLKYFETQTKALVKQLKWHETLALLDVELAHKLGQDNVVLNALNRKEKFQVEKPLTKTSALGHFPRGKQLKEEDKGGSCAIPIHLTPF